MTGPRLVVFDVDGTLVDSQHHILAAMQARLRRRRPAAPGARRPRLPSSACRCRRRWRPSSPHLPEAEVAARSSSTTATSFAEQRAAGGGDRRRSIPARAPRWSGWRREPATLLGVATGKARRGLDHILAGPRPRPPLRHRPDRRRASLASRTPPCCSPRWPRPASRPGRGGHGRRHRVRHRHGPRRRHRDRRRRLGLPSRARASRPPAPTRSSRASTRSTPPSPASGTAARELDPAPPLLEQRHGPPGGRRLRGRPRRAGRCGPRRAHRSSSRPRARRGRSPPNGTRSTPRSAPSACP